MDVTEALTRCQLVHDLRQCPVDVASPQTSEQVEQVARIIGRLQEKNRMLEKKKEVVENLENTEDESSTDISSEPLYKVTEAAPNGLHKVPSFTGRRSLKAFVPTLQTSLPMEPMASALNGLCPSRTPHEGLNAHRGGSFQDKISPLVRSITTQSNKTSTSIESKEEELKHPVPSPPPPSRSPTSSPVNKRANTKRPSLEHTSTSLCATTTY